MPQTKPNPFAHLDAPAGTKENMQDMITVDAAALHFHVTPTTIRRWVKSGKIKSTQPGGPKGAIRVCR